jgi:hypothetical protein
MWGKCGNYLCISSQIWIKEIKTMSKYFIPTDIYLDAMSAPSGTDIWTVCFEIAEMLVDKNRSYGDSALSPVRIFSKASPMEQLAIRIDDKLSRLTKGHEFLGDNDLDDLIGYLILLKVARERENLVSQN